MNLKSGLTIEVTKTCLFTFLWLLCEVGRAQLDNPTYSPTVGASKWYLETGLIYTCVGKGR